MNSRKLRTTACVALAVPLLLLFSGCDKFVPPTVLCDTITVMRDGNYVDTRSTAQEPLDTS